MAIDRRIFLNYSYRIPSQCKNILSFLKLSLKKICWFQDKDSLNDKLSQDRYD